ncbi:MAG: thermonuclease family protein [Clostridia bacterium]|nr:thermonuclease family protein [Clostridia bacterium]
MKKKFLSLLLLVCVIFGVFTGCTNSTPQPGELVDYAAQAVLDLESDETIKQEVTVRQYIDGDTTYFYFPRGAEVPAEAQEIGYIKARYLAVNTPESTGLIEPWGKKASDFTKNKLKSADSIILETESNKWEADSTKHRFLVWVWYRPAGELAYHNLNLELLQEGLAIGSKSGESRYGKLCTPAIAQAKAHSLHVYSKENDPDFYYGTAYEIDLKELRTNIEFYNGKRVAFEATVTQYENWSVYVEDYDEESDMYYGISVFYGYNAMFHDILARGNRVRMVGNVSYYEAGGTYQISSLQFDRMNPTDPENVQKLEDGQKAAYLETDIDTFLGDKTVSVVGEGEEMVDKTFKYAQLAMNTSVKMCGLEVVDTYTTHNGGDNDGAISLTCRLNGKTIIVRTAVLKDGLNIVPEEYKDANNVVLESYFEGKTIDVKGIVDYFDGSYQIRAFSVSAFTFHS